MDNILIKQKIEEIINSFVDDKELTLKDKVHIILSESYQALNYISSIEDEFDIDFDDDDVDMEFFLNVQKVEMLVKKRLKDKLLNEK